MLVIIAATLVVYWPAQRNGFVWDDTALVQRDPLIRSWRNIPEGFRHFLFIDATASSFYRPLQRLTFTADYAIWDRTARGWHLSSIYLHLAAALALYFFSKRLLGNAMDERWALAVATLWAIHPLHTSAVTYISGRADPLQALFGFVGLTLGLIGLDGGKRARLATVGAALCFLCALLSKEGGIAALLIWLVILAWQRVPRRVWATWLGLGAAVLAIYGGLRSSAESTPPPEVKPTPLAVRPILAARAVAEYAGLILAPVNLRMERDVSSGVGPPEGRQKQAPLREWQTLLGLALIGAGVCWWRWSRRRISIAALCLVAGLVAYLPISNLFSLNATVAEHWLYVPLAFFFLAVAASLHEVLAGSRLLKIIAGFVVAAWAIWLGMLTWQRQADWKDQRTFLTRTIQAGGDSARMRINLGQLLSADGQDELALEQFREALRRAPDQVFAQMGAAAVLIRMQRFAEAEPFLASAERNAALSAECRHLRASMLRATTGADPVPELRQAAREAPRSWPVWRRYFLALAQTNRRVQAITELGAFLNEQSFRAESWALLGDFLAAEHDYPRAVAAFEEATRLDVHDNEPRQRIAIIRRTPPAP